MLTDLEKITVDILSRGIDFFAIWGFVIALFCLGTIVLKKNYSQLSFIIFIFLTVGLIVCSYINTGAREKMCLNLNKDFEYEITCEFHMTESGTDYKKGVFLILRSLQKNPIPDVYDLDRYVMSDSKIKNKSYTMYVKVSDDDSNNNFLGYMDYFMNYSLEKNKSDAIFKQRLNIQESFRKVITETNLNLGDYE